jgi:hypothetical protein
VRRSRSVFGGREVGPTSDVFVAIAYVGAGIAAILVLVAAVAQRPAVEEIDVDATPDPAPLIRGELEDHSAVALAWRETLREICENLDLQAEGLAPSCSTGAITFGDSLFEKPTSPQLSEEGMRKAQLALPLLLETLRRREIVWRNLESIEIRGHSDPRARRDPYITNLVGSQKRPLGVMIYLSSEWALSNRDREDLQRLALISSSSFSRPPETCPDRSRECYPFWRRIEIIPHMRGERVREDMQQLVDRVEALLPEPDDASPQ